MPLFTVIVELPRVSKDLVVGLISSSPLFIEPHAHLATHLAELVLLPVVLKKVVLVIKAKPLAVGAERVLSSDMHLDLRLAEVENPLFAD
jgi:hypothetical protein